MTELDLIFWLSITGSAIYLLAAFREPISRTAGDILDGIADGIAFLVRLRGRRPHKSTPDQAADLAEALVRFVDLVATDPRDWSLDRRDAWIFGLMCGWDCEERHDVHDEDCGGDGAMREVAERHGWGVHDVERLRRYRAAIREVQEAASRAEAP